MANHPARDILALLALDEPGGFTVVDDSGTGQLAEPGFSGTGQGLPFISPGVPAVAATYYVHGETGSDAYGGLTSDTAFKTFEGLLAAVTPADGGTINVAENVRSNTGGPAAISLTGLSNFTIQQDAGFPQAWLCGDMLIGSTALNGTTGLSWVNTTGTKWTKNIGTGLTLSGVTFKWSVSTTASGHHYGFLKSAAGASNSGEYEYVSLTGVLTINVPSSPNTAAEDVTYSALEAAPGDVPSFPAAIQFVGGANNRVTGLYFRLYCVATAALQAGWAVRFSGSHAGHCVSCKAWDMGFHIAGCIGAPSADNSGCVIENCEWFSLQPGGAHVVFHQNTSGGDLSGCRARGCIFHGRRRLGLAATPVAGLTASTQFGVYTHVSSDSGSAYITDVMAEACTFINYGDGSNGDDPFLAMGAGNTAVPATPWVWSSYAARTDRCTFTNFAYMRHDSYLSHRRGYIDLLRAGASGLNDGSSRGMLCTSGYLGLESCVVVCDTTNGSFQKNIIPQGSGGPGRFYFLNTSFWNDSTTAGQYLMLGDYAATQIHARGCVFAGRTGYNLLANDTDAAFVCDFLDCTYYNVTGIWSEVASRDTQAEWLATVDTAANGSARVLSADPYADPPDSLAIDPESALWTLRRSTSAVVPTYGFNDAYASFFGAYQYPASSSHRITRVDRDGEGRVARM